PYGRARKTQWPGGVGELTPSAHLVAIASCCRVRCFNTSLTSATSFAINPDEVDGGGAGRSLTMSSGVIIQAFTFPNSGSIGGGGGFSSLSQAISPRADAAAAIACQIAALAPAAPMP